MPLSFSTNSDGPISFRDFDPNDFFTAHLQIPDSTLNLYVSTTGSDSNGDGSIDNPFRTTDFACSYVRETYNTAVTKISVTPIQINVAAGTYTDKVHAEYLFGVQINGAGDSTIFDSSNTGTFGSFGPCLVGISNIKIQNTDNPGHGKAFYTNGTGAVFFLSDVTFGAGYSVQIAAESQSRILISAATCKIAGGAANFGFVGSYGFIDITGGSTINISGGPYAYSDCFMWSAGGTIFVESDTVFTGTATGKRFRVENGGQILTGDGTITSTAGFTFLPGDAAGEGFSFGAYDNYIFDTNVNDTPNTQTGAAYTVVNTDKTIIANRAGTVTLTLPSAASWPGRRLLVKTIQAQTVVSASSNVVPLVGGSAGTAILAGTAGKWAELYSDATNWVIMAGA